MTLEADETKIVQKIPENLKKKNVFIQIKSFSKTTTLHYFSTSLKVHLIEAFAQIKVTDNENTPLSQVLKG